MVVEDTPGESNHMAWQIDVCKLDQGSFIWCEALSSGFSVCDLRDFQGMNLTKPGVVTSELFLALDLQFSLMNQANGPQPASTSNQSGMKMMENEISRTWPG